MARKSWPTQSKGVFADTYKNPGESSRPRERSMQTVNATVRQQDTERSRMVHEKKNGLTKDSMRKPHK